MVEAQVSGTALLKPYVSELPEDFIAEEYRETCRSALLFGIDTMNLKEALSVIKHKQRSVFSRCDAADHL